MNFPANVPSCKSIKRSQHIIVTLYKFLSGHIILPRETKVLKSRSSIVYITKREEKCVELKRFSDILISLVAMKFTVQ